MTTATRPRIRLSVVIFPHEGMYAASCLELSTVSVKKTPEEAAAGITRLIDGLFSWEVKNKLPIEEELHPATAADFCSYNGAVPFQHTPSLSPEAQSVIEGIDYRLSPYHIHHELEDKH